MRRIYLSGCRSHCEDQRSTAAKHDCNYPKILPVGQSKLGSGACKPDFHRVGAAAVRDKLLPRETAAQCMKRSVRTMDGMLACGKDFQAHILISRRYTSNKKLRRIWTAQFAVVTGYARQGRIKLAKVDATGKSRVMENYNGDTGCVLFYWLPRGITDH